MTHTKGKGDRYEEVAQRVLTELASHLGIKSVQGKQDLIGDSGTSWEADLVAYDEDDRTIKIECKYRKSSRDKIKQGEMGAFALSVIDTGSAGGILVTSHEVQEGAQKVADKFNVRVVELREGSTMDAYIAKIKDALFVGITDSIELMDECQIIVTNVKTGEVKRYD